MKKLLLGLLLAGSTMAFGTVVYDNGGPNLVSGNELCQWMQTEDVANTGTNTFNTLRFWTFAFYGTNIHDADVAFWYDDGAGNPGALALEYFLPVASVATGNLWGGFAPEFENTVALPTITATGTFTYHVGILGNFEDGAAFRQDIYWETTDPNGTNTGVESYGDTRNNWSNNGQEHAFRLEYNAVPEPASMIALGVGALALLRRRNKK